MTSRSSVAINRPSGCSLVTGEPSCSCPEEAPRLADRQIVVRATDKFRWQQQASPDGRNAARRGLDGLLARPSESTVYLAEGAVRPLNTRPMDPRDAD